MKPAIRRIALLIVAALACTAHAQSITESRKITPNEDETLGDRFGSSVAIDGTTAIVGAHLNEDLGHSSGSAYLFDAATGNQLFELEGSNTTGGHKFGFSVAVSGTCAIVGAPGAVHYAGSTATYGSAYLFDTTTGKQLHELFAPDAESSNSFASAVAMSNTTVIVGSHRDDGLGHDSGSAYLFDTTTGKQLFKLTASDAAAGDRFGYAVAISGTTAIVGAFGDSDAGTQSGSAYLFDTTTGKQLFKLTADDADFGDWFGWSVAISGTTAIVGAAGHEVAGGNSGSAYLFDTTIGKQVAQFTANDAAAGDHFGYAVAIAGTTAIVGSSIIGGGGPEAGSAYLFDTITGQQVTKLVASELPLNFNGFGTTVAISGTTAIVGAMFDYGNSDGFGSAYLFDRPPCNAADLADPQSTLDLADIVAFVTAYTTLDPAADLTGDGLFDLDDIDAFTTAFIAGCP